MTVAEVERGICKLRRAGSGERADALARWLEALLDDGAERILSLDANVGRIAGGLSDRATAIGRHPGFADVAIAVADDLTIVTRNGRHFAPLGVAFVDPLATLPGR